MFSIPGKYFHRYKVFLVFPFFCLFSNAHASEGYSVLTKENIRSIEASSFLNLGDPTAWGPENIVDKRPEAPWVPDRSKPFKGEWIQVNFIKEFVISKIGIVIGHTQDSRTFNNDGRPKKLTLVFSNGFTQDIDLADTMDMQYFTLDNIKSSYIKLIIQEKYQGLTLPDICIGELEMTVKENEI